MYEVINMSEDIKRCITTIVYERCESGALALQTDGGLIEVFTEV